MKPLTCPEALEHIELYTADECDAALKEAIAGHLTTCPRCRRASEEAAELQALLGLRLRERDNLRALQERLRREDIRERQRRRPVILFLLKRVTAVAAMLFVMVGALGLLGLWQPRQPSDAGPQVAVLWQSDDAEIRRSAPGRVEVLSGQVHLQIVPGDARANEAEVQTPAGLARAKESRLFVEVAPARDKHSAAGAAVLVLSGKVSFSNPKGQTTVRPGEVVETSGHAAPHAEPVNTVMQEKAILAPAARSPRDWGQLYRALSGTPPAQKRKDSRPGDPSKSPG